MKTICIILMGLGLAASITAQTSFSLNFTDTCFTTGTNSYVAIEGTLRNKNASPLQMSLLLKNVHTPSDWSVVACDPQQCLPLGIVFSTFTMSPNQVAPIFVDFTVGNTAGVGTAEIELTDLNNSETSLWALKVTTSTTTNTVTYQLEEQKPILVEWFNFQGQRIQNIKTVPSGIYIRRLSFERQAASSTQVYVNND